MYTPYSFIFIHICYISSISSQPHNISGIRASWIEFYIFTSTPSVSRIAPTSHRPIINVEANGRYKVLYADRITSDSSILGLKRLHLRVSLLFTITNHYYYNTPCTNAVTSRHVTSLTHAAGFGCIDKEQAVLGSDCWRGFELACLRCSDSQF